jgi:enoyl-CoA hydratase/3-hydroxyacyl-CoA dehydrogenase
VAIVRGQLLLDNSIVYRIHKQDPAMTKPFANPLLATPDRPLPRAVAVIGAGTIGPDIGYYLKSALPGLKLYLVDVNAEGGGQRPAALRQDYSCKAVAAAR